MEDLCKSVVTIRKCSFGKEKKNESNNNNKNTYTHIKTLKKMHSWGGRISLLFQILCLIYFFLLCLIMKPPILRNVILAQEKTENELNRRNKSKNKNLWWYCDISKLFFKNK
jgi:hypothetical protein